MVVKSQKEEIEKAKEDQRHRSEARKANLNKKQLKRMKISFAEECYPIKSKYKS